MNKKVMFTEAAFFFCFNAVLFKPQPPPPASLMALGAFSCGKKVLKILFFP